MGQCSSCGRDLPGLEQLCHQCYTAQYAELTAPKGDSSYGWSAYMQLLLWIFVSYEFFTYMPDFVRLISLLAVLVVLWFLDFTVWSMRTRKSYATRIKKSYATPLWLSCIVLGLFCGVVWKITGEDVWGVWGRLGIACLFVGGIYRSVYIVIDLARLKRELRVQR